MDTSLPKLSIIIPAYNEEFFIGPCLDSIACQSTAPDEVIVVDNNSCDRTVEIARSYPFVRVLFEKKQGMIPARNTGLDAARGDLLARIDADTQLPPYWIETVHTIADQHSGTIFGISGPQYFYDIHTPIIRDVVSLILSKYGFFAISKFLLGHETLFGSNMVISHIAWQKIRNSVCLDDLRIHEDIDMAIHINKYGHIYYDDRMKVGVSNRPLFEGPKKNLWRFQAWIETIHRHRRFSIDPKPIHSR